MKIVRNKKGKCRFTNLRTLGPGEELLPLFYYRSQLANIIKKNTRNIDMTNKISLIIRFPMFTYDYDAEDEYLTIGTHHYEYEDDTDYLVLNYKEAFKHLGKLKKEQNSPHFNLKSKRNYYVKMDLVRLEKNRIKELNLKKNCI